jgi:hypothetical protein
MAVAVLQAAACLAAGGGVSFASDFGHIRRFGSDISINQARWPRSSKMQQNRLIFGFFRCSLRMRVHMLAHAAIPDPICMLESRTLVSS